MSTRFEFWCRKHNKQLQELEGRPQFYPEDEEIGTYGIDLDNLNCPDWAENTDECQDDWKTVIIFDDGSTKEVLY